MAGDMMQHIGTMTNLRDLRLSGVKPAATPHAICHTPGATHTAAAVGAARRAAGSRLTTAGGSQGCGNARVAAYPAGSNLLAACGSGGAS
jgi:hypothetical protein